MVLLRYFPMVFKLNINLKWIYVYNILLLLFSSKSTEPAFEYVKRAIKHSPELSKIGR